MDRLLRPMGGWLAAAVLVAVTVGALSVRGRLAEEPSASSQVAVASVEPTRPAETDAVFAGAPLAWDDPFRRTPVPRPDPTPTATPRPTPAPTPPPPPPPPTPVPVAAAPTPDNGAGGGLAPRTAPPGWTPPATIPGDIWTTGSFGQTLSSGGITVTATRLPLDTDSSGCDDGNPIPAGYVRVGFQATTSWSGFPIPNFSADAPNQGLSTCWLGSPSPLVSGVTYQVFLQLPAAQAATTVVRMGYFPNGASPAYIFEFR